MKIGILETGPVLEPLQPKYGSYATIFQAMLAPVAPDFTFSRYLVYENDFPTGPMEADGWILTGSKYGAYEDHDWIAPLETFIRQAVDIRRPLAGFCFGHQIMAQALGGKVVKSDKGWGIGLSDYQMTELRPTWMTDAPDGFTATAIHQDQVIRAPEGANVLATSEFCPIAGLTYGDPDKPFAMSVQPHPEFEPDFTSDLIDGRLADLVSDAEADAARKSLSRPNHNRDWAKWVVGFFRDAASA